MNLTFNVLVATLQHYKFLFHKLNQVFNHFMDVDLIVISIIILTSVCSLKTIYSDSSLQTYTILTLKLNHSICMNQ